MTEHCTTAEKQASPPSAPPSPWRMLLLGLIILMCGIIIGSAATIAAERRALLRVAQHPGELSVRAADRLARRLDLTEQQRGRVEAILTERLQRLAQLRQRVRPDVDRELNALEEEVAAVLDERQQQRWRRDFTRLRELIQPPMPYSEGFPPG